MKFRSSLPVLPLLLLGLCYVLVRSKAQKPTASLRAGAAVVDISPQKSPVRVNGMFTERTADKVVDPLTARALVLDDGGTRLALCVVDTCMMPRDLIDAAKKQASEATGIPAGHMMVSATHTHSAPSAMGCLGSRMDPGYAAMLPGRIAQAITAAVENLQPARAGWTAFDDHDHTFNRRWIRRPDRIPTDPFGVPNVRANMHPGHQSRDVTGPSGPVDPQLSLLAVETADGKPLALLANYSMHYYDSPLLSSDYYGRFNVHIAQMLGAREKFVGIMSQGTSGDLMWMDYGAPRQQIGYDAYAKEIATRVAAAYKKIEWKSTVPLAAAESVLTLNYRTPEPARIQWAQAIKTKLGDRLPQSQQEIYALESLILHERQTAELKLQALRIGDLGIAALPNEVFCLTGLKLKARSPFPLTMNISLANGADGYIPPPEQHALGGYTTWPARTAGLEVQAEPKITAALLSLLEKASGQPARKEQPSETDYSKAVTALKPAAFWRMEEMDAGTAQDSAARKDAAIEPGVAVYLPGAGEPASRAFHFAGGRVKSQVKLGDNYSVAFFMWNGLPVDVRTVTGYAFSRGRDGDKDHGEHLGIGGTHTAEAQGRLILFNGNTPDQLLTGKTKLALKAWHHVVLVREGTKARVYLDGKAEPDLEGELPVKIESDDVFVGGRADNFANWEGKLDEFALFDRALIVEEITGLYQASGLKPPAVAQAVPEFPPLSPEDALKSIHVPEGFKVELVACEPNVIDPIAIDWDLAGRLWVVEMADYPSGMDNNGKPSGRVRVLEDTDGDGRYEKSTLFADGLNFPTGLLAWRDGVIVTAAPDVLFLKDTNGDGKADSTEKLISGLSEGNQQLRANGLRWGLDNRVYCAAGGHHGGHAAETVLRSHKDGKEEKIGSRDFSFDPDTGNVRAESGPSQFGRNRDDAGHWFGTQNSRALWHYVIPDHYLKRNPYVPAPDPTHQILPPNSQVYPLSPPEKRFHSFEDASHFTSACSGMIYRDELLWPRRDNELDAFTCEPFHNLVQHNILVEDGVTWKATRAPGEEEHDFFASNDRWCRPVMTRTGPDGALWVVDMYRYMIEHPAWLPDEGKAETLPFYRLGDDKGRIYRVFRTDKPPRRPKPLDKLTPEELVKAMESPNEWQRDKAQMTIAALSVSHGDPVDASIRDAAWELLKSKNPLARMQAIWLITSLTRHAPGGETLKDTDARVRENAIKADKDLVPGFLDLADDQSIKVRLQFVLSAGNWPHLGEPPTEEWVAQLRSGVVRIAIRDHADPWMRAAVMTSAVPHCRALCEGIAAAGGEAFSAYADDLSKLALALDDRDSLAAMLRPMLTAQSGRYSADQIQAYRKLLGFLGHEKFSRFVSAREDELSRCLRQGYSLVMFCKTVLPDESFPVEVRAAAAGLLLSPLAKELREPAALQLLAGWLSPAHDQKLQLLAVRTLESCVDDAIPAAVLPRLATLSPTVGNVAVDAMLTREPWALALLEHVKANPANMLDATQRARLAQHSSKKVRDLAMAVLKMESSRKEVLEQFRPALSLKGDAARGKTVAMRCIACHQVDGAGLAIGPDLKSVANHPAEKLLTNIVDPSLDVQPGYFAFNAKIKDGSTLYGLITSETGNSVAFKLPGGSTRLIARSDLADLKSTGQSLMPAGLEAGMSVQEMADLIAWLKDQSGK